MGPLLVIGGFMAVGGWSLLIWGCVNYMRWKGVSVHVPQIRLTSEDVQKFFDSLKLSAEPGTSPHRGGM